MDYITGNLDVLIVVAGSFLGSIKANFEFEKTQHCLARALDIALGVFVGVSMAYHYGSTFSIWLEGLIALVGGVSGTMLVEVFMQVLPSLAKGAIKRFFQSKLP